MKKIFAALFLAAMVFAFYACSSSAPAAEPVAVEEAVDVEAVEDGDVEFVEE